MRSFPVEGGLRFSRKWRCQSYMPMVPVGGGDDYDGALLTPENHHSLRSFSYQRLPQQLLKLSILKLDGSCFEVQIARKASISELKQAIENIFSKSSKEGGAEISWSHVWGHFCLSYQDTKLINDKESLRRLGIKDGDQLHFVRHVSINYYPEQKKDSRNARSTSKHLNVVSMRESGVDEENEEEEEEEDFCQEDNRAHHPPVKETIVGRVNFRPTHLLKGCLSHSRLWGRTKRTDGPPHPSKLAGHCVKVGRKITLL